MKGECERIEKECELLLYIYILQKVFSSSLCYHLRILRHFLSKKNDKKKVRDSPFLLTSKNFIQFDFDDSSSWFLETHH